LQRVGELLEHAVEYDQSQEPDGPSQAVSQSAASQRRQPLEPVQEPLALRAQHAASASAHVTVVHGTTFGRAHATVSAKPGELAVASAREAS
jgi:hypothetical protein